MSFEEEFDKIVKQKAGEADFPFDEKNWEKASNLLNASRKAPAKTIGGMTGVSKGLMVALGSVVFISTLYFYSTQQTKKSIVENSSNKKNNQTPAQVSTNSPNSESLKNTSPSAAITANTFKSQGLENTKAETSNSTFEQNTGKLLTTTNPKSTAADSHMNLIGTPKTEAAGKESKFELHTQNTSVSSEITQDIVSDKKSKNESEFNQEKNELSTNNKETNQHKQTSEINYEPGSKLFEKPEAPAQIEQASVELPVAPMQNSNDDFNTSEFLLVEWLEMKSLIFKSEVDEQELITSNQLKDEDYYKLLAKKYPINFIGLGAGTTYLSGWNNNSKTDAKGFNWYVGLYGGHYFNKHVGLGIGMEMYNIQHISQPFYKSSGIEYTFGSSNSYTLVSTKNLLYLSIPLKVYYRINSNHQFALGLNSAFLVDSKNTLQSFHPTELNAATEPIQTNHGVYSGMNRNNMLVTLDYRLKVFPKCYLEAAVFYGLSDIFENNKTVSLNEKAKGFRIGLHYTLFEN